jgi:hypothetical protein
MSLTSVSTIRAVLVLAALFLLKPYSKAKVGLTVNLGEKLGKVKSGNPVVCEIYR